MTHITIIIATYNSGKTLRNALDSVFSQSFQDWECIVIDGASKDDTLRIVEEFEKKDSRFRHISEPDKGIYDAFNKGWRFANGDWIYYLGSDDTLTPDGMELLVEELDERYAVITGDVYLHRIDGSVRPQLTNGFFGCHQGVLMQRKILEKMGGFDEQYHIVADYDLLVRTKNAGYEVKNIRCFIANFTVGGESQKFSSLLKRIQECYFIDIRNNARKSPFLHALRRLVENIVVFLYRNSLILLKK